MAYNFQNFILMGGIFYRNPFDFSQQVFRMAYFTEDSQETVETAGYINWELNHNAAGNGDITLQDKTELDVLGVGWRESYVVRVDDFNQTVTFVRKYPT